MFEITNVKFEDIDYDNFSLSWDIPTDEYFDLITHWEVALKDPNTQNYLWGSHYSYKFNKNSFPLFNDRVEITLNKNIIKNINPNSIIGVRAIMGIETSDVYDTVLPLPFKRSYINHKTLNHAVIFKIKTNVSTWNEVELPVIIGEENETSTIIFKKSFHEENVIFAIINFSSFFVPESDQSLIIDTPYGNIEISKEIGELPEEFINSEIIL